MNARILKIDIRDFWIAGSGQGDAFGHDVKSRTYDDGLPILPGRHIKGLLRAAVAFAYGDRHSDALFGIRNGNQGEQGASFLRFSNGTLPRTERAAIVGDLVPLLFRSLSNTAMQNGVAKDHSLREMQVCIPLLLHSKVEVNTICPPAKDDAVHAMRADWAECLETVFPLVSNVGGKRNSGFGRSILSWKEL